MLRWSRSWLIYLSKEDGKIVNGCVLTVTDYTHLSMGPGQKHPGVTHKMTEEGSRHTQWHEEKVLNPSICSSLCSLDFDKIKYQEDHKEVNLVELTVPWDC